MTEDRELLELAAKAAGYTVCFGPLMSMGTEEGTYYTIDWGYPKYNREGSSWWNPLLCNDDAFRLAVELSIFQHSMLNSRASHLMTKTILNGKEIDWNAAYRRAIVELSAEKFNK